MSVGMSGFCLFVLWLASYLWMMPLGKRGGLHWKEAVLEASTWIWGEVSPAGGAGCVLNSAVGPLLQQLKQVQASTPMEYVVKGCRPCRVCWVALPSDSCGTEGQRRLAEAVSTTPARAKRASCTPPPVTRAPRQAVWEVPRGRS